MLDLVFIYRSAGAWWDAGIYAGMGKYLFSRGTIGIWEEFRPPLWPIVIGMLWKAGLDFLLWTKILECISALGLIVLVYLLGNELYPDAGLYSAIIFGWTPVVLFFTAIQITDMPSAFFAVLGVYMTVRKKPAAAGLAASLACILRFPAGLIIVPICIYSLIRDRATVKNTVLTSGFFLIIPLAYLISNVVAYAHPFLPLMLAIRSSVSGSIDHNPFFYIQGLFEINPFIIFGLVSVAVYFIQLRKHIYAPYTLIFLALIIIGGYFSLVSHKELRYGIAFLPYLSIAAGTGLALALNHFKTGWKIMAIASTVLIISMIGIWDPYISVQWPAVSLSPAYSGYYDFLKIKGKQQS